MKIYEYQVKEIFRKENIEIPEGIVAFSPEESEDIARKIGGDISLKSQVHTGGRGKVGGIKFVSGLQEVKKEADKLFGSELKGETVESILIEKKEKVLKEYYLGFTLNRKTKKTTLIFSPCGGMEIEKVAKEQPKKVIKVDIDPLLGIQKFHLNRVNALIDYDREITGQLNKIIYRLYNIYTRYDAILLEINPLALVENGKLIALDGKLEMDDNAAYRQNYLMEMWDRGKEDPIELLGRKEGFVVIKLSASVSVISNGAGLAISTLDILNHHGTGVANILDLSGGATAEKVERAVKVVIEDKDVEAILFNIFGGITRCDEIATGITNIFNKIPQQIPVVCRLQGTNKDKGINILQKAGISAFTELDRTVRKIVSLI